MTRIRLIHRINSFLLTGLLLVLLTSCHDNRVFEESIKIDQGTWAADNILGFSAVISDTLCGYSMYIDVRNDISYSYSNLYFFMKTVFPNGRIARDTIECMLAGYDGKWLGSGSGNVRFNRFLFQKDIRLPVSGSYRFELEQAMRVEELKGILDIGFRIDKVN
ncbi:MAG: gliding motility lipoprotein GldH [Bacteroidales bacterium]|nr:gliding motility lipoprotein GldH [Bacteroidales bacterium]